jgi:hypothetical protein
MSAVDALREMVTKIDSMTPAFEAYCQNMKSQLITALAEGEIDACGTVLKYERFLRCKADLMVLTELNAFIKITLPNEEITE